MSAEAKRIKILTLAQLFVGLALIVGGIVMLMGDATPRPFILGVEGILTLAVGARGALIANVPARIGKLAVLMLVALMVQCSCVAFVVFFTGPENVSGDPVPCCMALVPAVFSLVIALLSSSMSKHAER